MGVGRVGRSEALLHLGIVRVRAYGAAWKIVAKGPELERRPEAHVFIDRHPQRLEDFSRVDH